MISDDGTELDCPKCDEALKIKSWWDDVVCTDCGVTLSVECDEDYDSVFLWLEEVKKP